MPVSPAIADRVRSEPAPGTPSLSRIDLAWYWLLVPVLMVALAAAFLQYDNTLAEPDIVRMMAALVYGEATGAGIHAGQHYGVAFSFGYYYLLYALAPLASLGDPDGAARLLNQIGWVAAILMALSLTQYLQSLFGRRLALAISLAFLGSPMMLPFVISGHPMVAASACLFFGGWLLTLLQRPGRAPARALYALSALAALVVALTFRADVALAFPFIALGCHLQSRLFHSDRWRGPLAACAILLLAFVVFLVLQRPHVAEQGSAGAVAGFVGQFMSLGRIGRGAGVFVLGFGLVSMLLLLAALFQHRGLRPAGVGTFWLALALALPSLAFWLPNPQPARHFLFASLGGYILLACLYRDKLGSAGRALLFAVLCILANQAASELLHPVLAAHYHWTYQPMVARRATQQLPAGAFVPDQRANIAAEAIKRAEAIALAASRPARLLILADSQYYLIAHLIAGDRSLRVRKAQVDGFDAVLLESATRSIYLVQKDTSWPRDVLDEIVRSGVLPAWPIYVQQATKTAFDRVSTPPERIFQVSH